MSSVGLPNYKKPRKPPSSNPILLFKNRYTFLRIGPKKKKKVFLLWIQ